MKANADLVDEDTLKQVSLTNLHVLEVTCQALGIAHIVLQVRLQLSKVLEVQYLEHKIFEVQTLEV